MKCPVNKLLVTIDQKYQDKSGQLQIDTSYHPEEYATLKGRVFSIPDRVDPDYWKGHIDELARPGDEVWFSYAVVYDFVTYREGETPEYRNLVIFEGQEYWMVNYEDVFCVVREGEIMMPTQNVLLAPVKNEEDGLLSCGLQSVIHAAICEDRAMVIALPAAFTDCKVGDIVPVEQEFLQKYILFDEPHYILSTSRIIAKWI